LQDDPLADELDRLLKLVRSSGDSIGRLVNLAVRGGSGPEREKARK
jgi:hypothetical protein